MGRERQHGLVVVFKACAIFAGVFIFMLYMGKVLGLLWEKVMAPLLRRMGCDFPDAFDNPNEKILSIDGQRVGKPITRAEGKNNALSGLNPLNARKKENDPASAREAAVAALVSPSTAKATPVAGSKKND